MPATVPQSSFGTTLTLSTDTSNATVLAHIVSFTVDNERDYYDVTPLSKTSGGMKFLKDPVPQRTLSGSAFFENSATHPVSLGLGTLLLTFPDAETLTCTLDAATNTGAYFLEYSPTLEREGVIMADFKLRISGAVTWS